MASTTWTPAPGRHKVNVGTSLTRALKARKGTQPPQKSNKFPDRDFYALRYNFKPPSIDSTKSASMEVKRNKDGPNSSIIVEHPARPSGAHVYRGREDPAKEWACVLIFDEETGSYTLEKIESFVALQHMENRAESLIQPAPSPLPSASAAERSTREPLEDQDGGVDSDFAEILPDELVKRKEEDSEEDIPIQQTAPSRPPPAPSRPTQPAPKARPKPASEPLPPPPAAASKPKKAPKRSTPEFSDPEDMVDFAKSTTTSKRARPSPPPPAQAPVPAPIPTSRPPAVVKPAPVKRAPAKKQSSPPPPRPRAVLELPGAGGSFVPPAPLAASSASSSRQPPPSSVPPAAVAAPPLVEEPPAAIPGSDSEEDDDWDEVPAPLGVSKNIMMIEETPGQDEAGEEIDVDVFAEIPGQDEAGEEIDVDAFADLMNEQLGDEEVGDGPVEEDEGEFGLFPDSPELQHEELPIQTQMPGKGPISLNALVGGGGGVDDDEEYSSSEDESEDD